MDGKTTTVADYKLTEHTCASALGGERCDICFGPIPNVVVPQLTSEQLLKLAREVAMDVMELDTICKGFSITPEQYALIADNIFFQRALDAYRQEWHSSLSTRERIRVQSAMALEAALPSLAAKMIKKEESFDAQIKAGQLLSKIAGVEEQKQELSSGEKFTITINLGADQQLRYEKEVAPKPPSTSPILQITEGEEGGPPVQALPEKDPSPTPIRPVPERTGTN